MASLTLHSADDKCNRINRNANNLNKMMISSTHHHHHEQNQQLLQKFPFIKTTHKGNLSEQSTIQSREVNATIISDCKNYNEENSNKNVKIHNEKKCGALVRCSSPNHRGNREELLSFKSSINNHNNNQNNNNNYDNISFDFMFPVREERKCNKKFIDKNQINGDGAISIFLISIIFNKCSELFFNYTINKRIKKYFSLLFVIWKCCLFSSYEKLCLFNNKNKNNINNNNNINDNVNDNDTVNKTNHQNRHQHRITLLDLMLTTIIIIIIIPGHLNCVNAHTQQYLNVEHSTNFINEIPKINPLDEFSNHAIIRPQIHHGRHKRSMQTTEDIEGIHAPHITLSYEHNGEKVIADLHLNEDLIPEGHFLRYQKSKEEKVVKNLTKTEVDLCHYQGTIRGVLNSRVAVSTCSGVNGIVITDDETYFIHSGSDGSLHDDHYLFKYSDMKSNATCGFENEFNRGEGVQHNIHFPSKRNLQGFNTILRHKRSTSSSDVIRGPYNANRHSSFVELVIVVDNKVYKSFGENMKKVHHHCKDIANIVNALYVPLNIFIALVGVVVWNEVNEIEFSNNGDTTLKNFLHYRRKELTRNHPNDNAQLLTKETFEGGVVGKALKGPICTFEYSGGVSVEHSPQVAVVATTVAHEMGHNFGMEHDNENCECVDVKCIMSASSTLFPPKHWSSCSIDQLNMAFSRGMNYCLRNKPTKLFESPQCGNGFVEVGEQCDCGLPEYCENSCCDPNTCMLHTNASCATGECCDLSTCRPKTAGTMCRPAEEECDLPEYCTGESEYCPGDVFKRNTESCDKGNAFCYQGNCRSRTSQCKILWGPTGNSSEFCYDKNVEGTRLGNCGFDRLENQYKSCKREDIKCGMLHCRHVNERLEFGMESVAVLSHSFMHHEGTVIPCRTAIVDLGLQTPDPGLTPNGAKCGDNSMCVNQKCMVIADLRLQGIGKACPENCHGNGICNSEGHCHCEVGFSPPYCDSPGPGGSKDSGPATNPNSRVGFTRALYIFFLGVVPVTSLFFLFVYYRKQNRPMAAARKTASVLKVPLKNSHSRGPTSPSSGGMPTSTPSSTDDMNSALLKSAPDDGASINNGMFGKFKGFTLRPLPTEAAGAKNFGAPNVAFVHPVSKHSPLSTQSSENNFSAPPSNTVLPVRSAPAPPVPKPPVISSEVKISLSNEITKGQIQSSFKEMKSQQNQKAPALPPPNPGFNARPIISSPVLEASTCTAKELISPLKHSSGGLLPTRSAPTAPAAIVPIHNNNVSKQISLGGFDKRQRDGNNGTIKRIASFLKKDEKQSGPPKMKPFIDRDKLKTLEISAPIPVVEDEPSSDSNDSQKQLGRAQSMRQPNTGKKINIHSFGSMRQPSGDRPKSIVGARPKSPPPRPPAPAHLQNINRSVSSSSTNPSQNIYDDCEAIEAPLAQISEELSPTGSDNIYSVIDERSSSNDLLPVPLQMDIISGSSESMGLLGEIVHEMEKRNGDSIYAASTLKKKKEDKINKTNNSSNEESLYANASEINRDSENPECVKLNSTINSNGYSRPSMINTPIARVAPTRPDNQSKMNINLSQTAKPNPNTKLNSNSSQLSFEESSSLATNNKQTERANSQQKPSVLKQKSSIRTRSPSPTGNQGTKLSTTTTGGLTRTKPFASKRPTPNSSFGKNNSSNNALSTTKTSDVNGKKPMSGNLSQKPKPLSDKPNLINNKSFTTSKSATTGGNFRQNSLNDTSNGRNQNIPASSNTASGAAGRNKLTSDSPTAPKLLSGVVGGNNFKTNNISSKFSNNNNNSNNNINTSNNSTTMMNSGNSKFSNSGASSVVAAYPGKASKVASLQQKFENVATTNKSNHHPPPSSSS